MIGNVELMETIARLISPYALWNMPEDLYSPEWWEWSCDNGVRLAARDKAQNVIRGLDLELNQKTGVIKGRLPKKKEEA